MILTVGSFILLSERFVYDRDISILYGTDVLIKTVVGNIPLIYKYGVLGSQLPYLLRCVLRSSSGIFHSSLLLPMKTLNTGMAVPSLPHAVHLALVSMLSH